MKKNSMIRKREPRFALASTDYERKALQYLNADRNRTYPAISDENNGTRSRDVLRALAGTPNKFMLWGQVRRLARGIHKPSEALTSVSISKAFKMITSPTPASADTATAVIVKGAAA